MLGCRSSVSAGGRYVSYYSGASNLVPDDHNQVADVFIRDRSTGETIRLSKAADGTEFPRSSRSPCLSPDGRYVTFSSRSANPGPGSAFESDELYVHDRETGHVERLAISQERLVAHPVITPDGRWVVFHTEPLPRGFVPTGGGFPISGFPITIPEEPPPGNVWLHDRATDLTVLVSVALDGSPANGSSCCAVISADGRWVALHSAATNLAEGERRMGTQVFLHDLSTGEIRLVSRPPTEALD